MERSGEDEEAEEVILFRQACLDWIGLHGSERIDWIAHVLHYPLRFIICYEHVSEHYLGDCILFWVSPAPNCDGDSRTLMMQSGLSIASTSSGKLNGRALVRIGA